MLSSAMKFSLLFEGVLGAVCLISGIFAILLVIANITMPKKARYITASAMAVLVLFVGVALFPIGAEEHTNIVTIEGVSDNMLLRNEAYFSVDGEKYRLQIAEGQKIMYELLEGHEVELSYGKTRSLLHDGTYMLIDINLVDTENVSQETMAAIMSLQK